MTDKSTKVAESVRGPLYGKGKLDGTGRLDEMGPLYGKGKLDGTGRLDEMGPLYGRGPLHRTGRLDGKGPLQGKGPLYEVRPLSVGRKVPDRNSISGSVTATVRALVLMGVMLVAGAAASTEAAAQAPGSQFTRILQDSRISADLGIEFRGFPSKPRYDGQEDHAASIRADVEWYLDSGRHRFLIHPFARVDASDSRRSHFDIREGYWQYAGSSIEVRAGLAKVFWGVTESNHLVDIINQTDAIESPDGEDKLGQPMIQTSWIAGRVMIDTFVMPFFRERTFPGQEGRLRTPFVSEGTDAFRRDRIDLGARLFTTMGTVDLGLSAFHGTSREPLFDIDPVASTLDIEYPVITQVGLDVLAVKGAWIFKSESIYRSGFLSDFMAMTAGFEYTITNIAGVSWDLGVLTEYSYDGRDDLYLGSQEFKNVILDKDLFGGVRLAMNNARSSELLAGALADISTGERSLIAEFSQRFGNQIKLQGEVRAFQNTTGNGLLGFIRKDSYVQLSASYFL